MPERAREARLKKILVKDWGIKPWNISKLTARDLQDVFLAEHTEAYITEQQQARQQQGGMKSSRNSESYREFKQEMSEKYGGKGVH